jgi:hypothetical protein
LLAATRYVQEPQLEACGNWETLEQQVWDGKIDRKEARKQFKDLWSQVTIDDLPPLKEGLWQWDFPVPGYSGDIFSP